MRIVSEKTIPTRLLDPADRPKVKIAPVEGPARFWFVRMLFQFSGLLGSLAWLRLVKRLPPRELGLRLRNHLEAMGGLWIKAGQLISMLHHILPREACEELAKLQDQAYGFAPDLARKIIEEDLGGPIERFFDEFVDMPFAAASIGQLHRAHLRHEGVWVAIKVRRPHIAWLFQQQLAFLKFVARTLELLRLWSFLRPRELLREIEKIAIEEVDYRSEAANIRRMGKTLRKHKILAPYVFARYCTSRILVMEFIHGILMADYIRVQAKDPQKVNNWLAENNVDPRKVGQRLSLSAFRQVFEDNLFHGDMHPGNIILLRDSQVALIDFGSIGTIETEWQKRYCLMFRSIATREYSKAIDLYLLLCPTLPAMDVQELKEKLIFIIRSWEARTVTEGIPYHQKSLANLFDELARASALYGVQLNFQMCKNDRAAVTLDASMVYLIPDSEHPKLARRYFTRMARRAFKREIKVQKLLQDLVGFASVIGSIPDLVSDYKLFLEPVLRRQAQNHQASVNKLGFLFASVFRTLATGLLFGGFFLVLVFLRQHHANWVAFLGEEWLTQCADFVPRIGAISWIALFVLVAYGYRKALVMAKQFARVDVRS